MTFLYVVSEIGGVLLAITFHPESYGVGASCAGFGLIGYVASYICTNWRYVERTSGYGQLIFLGVVVIFFFATNQGLSLNPESRNIGH